MPSAVPPLRPWAGNLVILEVGDRADFVYAYYGDAFAAAFGTDHVGQSTAELPPPQRDILNEEYESGHGSAPPRSRASIQPISATASQAGSGLCCRSASTRARGSRSTRTANSP